jgi:hypothetical protein
MRALYIVCGVQAPASRQTKQPRVKSFDEETIDMKT